MIFIVERKKKKKHHQQQQQQKNGLSNFPGSGYNLKAPFFLFSLSRSTDHGINIKMDL